MVQPFAGGFSTGTTILVPQSVQQRSAAMVIVLTLATCGLYHLYWLYKTTDELKTATQDSSINPLVDVLLTLFTGGLWGIFVNYRNAQKIHTALAARNPAHKDQSQAVLILSIATYFVGVTHLIAQYLLQEELNELAVAAG